MSKNKERDKMIQYGTHKGHTLQEIRVIIKIKDGVQVGKAMLINPFKMNGPAYLYQ